MKLNRAKKPTSPEIFSKDKLYKDILMEAKILGLPLGAAEPIAKNVSKSVADWVTRRSAITELDLNQRLATEIKKYNADLVYVYQNRDKII